MAEMEYLGKACSSLPREPSEMDKFLAENDQAITSLLMLAEQLGMRLEAVLRPLPPSPDDVCSKPSETRNNLIARLEGERRRIVRASNIISGYIDRLEI